MKREHVKVGMVVYDKVTGFFVKVISRRCFQEDGMVPIVGGTGTLTMFRKPSELRPLTARERGE